MRRNLFILGFVISFIAVHLTLAFADGSGSATVALPDPSTDPGGILALFASLYAKGHLAAIGILVAFFGAEYASTHVAWLQVGKRTAYVAAVVGGLAVLAGPAAMGTTPNVSMLISALTTTLALLFVPKAIAK
jgi:hypothetical protein